MQATYSFLQYSIYNFNFKLPSIGASDSGNYRVANYHFYHYHYLIYQFGTEGHTQKARPVQGAYP